MDALKTAYSAFEVATLLGSPIRTVRYKAGAEHWQAQPRKGRGGGSLWLFASMPEHTQNAIRETVNKELLVQLAKEEAAKKYAKQRAIEKGAVAHRANSKVVQDRAHARAAILRPFKVWHVIHPLKITEARAIFTLEYNQGAEGEISVEPWVRETVPGFHVNSLANWEKAFEAKGIAGLGGVYGHRAGKGLIDNNADMKEYIVGRVAAIYKDTATDIHEGLKARFKGQKLPRLRQLQKWIATYRKENAAILLKFQNPDGYKNKYQVAFGDASAGIVRPNQLWELDSSPTDIMLADGTRHTLLACIDVYTRRALIILAKTSNSAAVCALLRKAILTFGIPEEIKTDNGSDYTSDQVTEAIKALESNQDLCVAFTPEQKPHIERFFRTFNTSLRRLPGFIGHCVADRKAIESQKSFAQRISKKKGEKPAIETRYNEEEFQRYADEWALVAYGERKHSSIGMSPNQRAAQYAGTIIRVEDERALDVLLMPIPGEGGERDITKKGIRLGRQKYYDVALVGRVGERVRCYYDLYDASRLYVYDENGKFVCVAVDPDLAGVSHRDIALAAKARQRKASEEERFLRKSAKKVAKAEIVKEILDSQREQYEAQNYPTENAVNTYTTPALAEAGKAARAGEVDVYANTPPEQLEVLEQIEREVSAREIAPNMPPDAQYALYYCWVIAEKQGRKIIPHQAAKIANFETTAVFAHYERVIQAQNGALPVDVLPYLDEEAARYWKEAGNG